MKTLLLTSVLILSLTTAASAVSSFLGGGPLYEQAQYLAGCFFINEGTANITPTAQQIFDNSGTSIAVTLTCSNGSALAPNKTCEFASTSALSTSVPYSCKVNFSAAPTNVRGSFLLYDSSYNVVAGVPLR